MNDRDFAHFESMYKFAKRIQRRIEGVSLETFLVDDDLQDSVLYAIGHIGILSLWDFKRHPLV